MVFLLRKTEEVFREYFLSSNGFYKSRLFTEQKFNRELTILLLRKVAPYFMTPSLSFYSPCSELVVKGLAGIAFAEDGLQVAVSNVKFLKANGHCFSALPTEVGHELLCSNPFISLILPLSYHVEVVAYSQLRKKGAQCICGKNPSHRLYILQCSVSCINDRKPTQLMLQNVTIV